MDASEDIPWLIPDGKTVAVLPDDPLPGETKRWSYNPRGGRAGPVFIKLSRDSDGAIKIIVVEFGNLYEYPPEPHERHPICPHRVSFTSPEQAPATSADALVWAIGWADRPPAP